MRKNKEQQGRAARAGLRGAALLAGAGLLTAALAPVTSAARHHGRRAAVRGVSYGGGVERALAGIRIGDSFRTVLQRYGNPSETQLEEIMLVAAGGASGGAGSSGGSGPTIPVKIFVGPSSPAPTGGGGSSGGGGGYPGGSSGGAGGGLLGALGSLGGGALFQQFGGYSATLAQYPGGGGYPGGGYPGGGYPGGSPGGGYPGGSPGGGYPGGAGGAAAGPAAGTIIKPDRPEYRWIYDEAYSDSLEFTFTPEGRVIQIRATGFRGPVRTNRGIHLGVKYSNVLTAYGNPEKQDYAGPVLSVDYTNRNHIGFQFYNQTLVGITVASVE